MVLIKDAESIVFTEYSILPDYINKHFNGLLEYCIVATKFLSTIMNHADSEIIEPLIDLDKHFNKKLDKMLEKPEARVFKLGFIKLLKRLRLDNLRGNCYDRVIF